MRNQIKSVLQKIASFQTFIFLLVAYVLMIPFAIIWNWRRVARGWKPWVNKGETLSEAHEQG